MSLRASTQESSSATDSELFLRYVELGDEDSFEEVVRRNSAALRIYLLNRLGCSSLAEDVMQETFLKMHLKGDQFDGRETLHGWLYTIATNACTDMQRRRKRLCTLLSLNINESDMSEEHADLIIDDRLMEPITYVELEQDKSALREAIEMLREPFRSTFKLVYIEGHHPEDVAQMLNAPYVTIRTRMSAGIGKLRKILLPKEESEQ